ncbi:hypothetical protein RIF29_22453 [Crotalaria pallida]|uniref:Inner centromere protein ARK-binding domain-containing protein n=1 Tax=Crotalaria pallida TaxID=3830 RepID=A0AAN9F6L8_CROPI
MRRMSTKEKHVAQIFDRTKRIIDQARQQCHIWEHHLFPKLILNGITPPPWLCNTPLHSLPKELNKDATVSEVLFSQPQFTVPFSGRHCSLFNNPGVVSDDVQYPIGLHDEVHASKKDGNKGDRLSNLPECSVNNDGCASSGGPPEFDRGAAISPQIQTEPRVLDSYHDPGLQSLAKLQRSKPRQKALQQRNSAKAMKDRSGDDNNARVLANTDTGPLTSTLQADHFDESELVKDLYSNIQSCSMEEVRRDDCVSQNCDKSNYSGRITRSKTRAQESNPLNVASSSVMKEGGPPFNNSNEPLEPVDRPCLTNGSCETKEAKKGEYQRKEAGSSAYHNGSTKSRSSNQERYNSELLKLDITSGRGKGVVVHDSMQPFAHSKLADLSKASDHSNGRRRNTFEDGDFCNKKQESNSHDRIGLPSSCPSPGDDLLMTGDSIKSIRKSMQCPEPLISQHSQDPAVSVAGSFRKEKDPDFCSSKAKECTSKSGYGEVYVTKDSNSQNQSKEISKSLRSNFCEQNATCSESVSRKSQNVLLTALDARRLSSNQKDSNAGTEIAMNSAEKENVAPVDASRNSRAVTMCPTEASLKRVSSANLDERSLLGKSLNCEASVTEKVLDPQENMPSGDNPAGHVEDRSATTVSKVVADSIEKDRSCLGSRFTSVSPEVGLDVSVMRLPSDFVMPKQLDFDDAGASSMNGISSPVLKRGRQGMSREEVSIILLEPVNLVETSLECQGMCNSLGGMNLMEAREALIREEGHQIEYCARPLEEADEAGKAPSAMSPDKELPVVHKELGILTSPLMNHPSTLQVASEVSSGRLSNEVMASKFGSLHGKLKNDERGTKSADAFSAAVTANDLHNKNLTVEFPSAALMDEMDVGWLSDGKSTGFTTDLQNFKSSMDRFTYHVEHSWPQHKRRKTETETKKILPASSSFLEKPLDSNDQRSVGRNLSIERESPKDILEVQHLASNQEDHTGLQFASNSLTEQMQYTGECQTMEEFSPKVRKEEKLMDGRDISRDNLLLPEANPSIFSVDSSMRCSMDGKVESWHCQLNCVQESAEHVSCVERSTLSRGIYPIGNAGSSFVSPGIQGLDMIGTEDTVPEFEGFVMQTDNAQTCIVGDEIELEKMNLLSDSTDYTSLGKSRFMHSPLCHLSTPYKLHTIPDIYQSLPNGLLEGMGLRVSLPQVDRRARSLSDCQPNCNGQHTPSVQTIWDRINSNFGSSGKRQSLKLELPCINEENENMDENADTFQNGIDSEGMARSVTRELPAEIIDNAIPSTSVLQDDILPDGRVDFVSTEFNFSGTHKKVKKKFDKQDGDERRFTSKGKENQSTSLGKNGAKRTTESLRNMSSRPKLSGKDSMKRPGPTTSEKKSTRNNIVSGITSFIPLVQRNQAPAVITGKREGISVPSLRAAEANRRKAEEKENERKKKENERKMKREALKLEQENLRLLELLKKNKEGERKKKEPEMESKKRQREEEKKEKERKKKRFNDGKKQQQEHEKTQAKKEHIEIQSRATGEEVQESKKFMDERENRKNLQLQDNREGVVVKIFENDPSIIRDSTNTNITKESCLEYSEAVNYCANNGKVTGDFIKETKDDLIINNSLQELSYEISPYKGSDDECEDEDDIPNNKFIPRWASKQQLSLAVSSQNMDPETIFPPQSFCNIVEVLPPKLRL